MTRYLSIFAIILAARVGLAQTQPFHWGLTNGPGTNAPAILQVNTNGDIIVGVDSTILRTTDHGAQWQLFPSTGKWGLSSTAMLPGGRFVLLYSLGTLVRFEADGSGQTTLGLTDAQSLTADRFGNLYCIVGPSGIYFPSGSTPDTIIVRSTDAGDSWQTFHGPDTEALHSFSADERNYYAATGSGVYISNDSGRTWKQILNGIPAGDYFNVTAGHNGRVWASISADVYFSTDYGQTWRQIENPGIGTLDVAAGPDNLAIGYGENLSFFNDTMSTIIKDSLYGYSNLAAVDSSGLWLATSSPGRFQDRVNLYSSSGGFPWIWNPMPAPLSSARSLTAAYSTIYAQVGSSEFVVDTSRDWRRLGQNPATLLGEDFFDNSLFESTTTGGLERSYDTGRTWKNIFPSDPPQMTYVAAASASVLYAGSIGIFKSTDSGNTWNETNDAGVTSSITALATDSSGTVYAGNGHGLFISSNQGDSWDHLTKIGRLEIDFIRTNAAGTVVAAGIGSKVYRSTDHGVTWQSITIPTAGAVTGVVLLPSGDVIVSSQQGVFYWPEGSSSFLDAGDGLQGRGVTALALAADGTVFAAVPELGVWKGSGSFALLGVRQENSTPKAMTAWPDPAQSFVNVIVPKQGNWTVQARDPLGRMWPVTYSYFGGSLHCNVGNFPNGAYELVLQLGQTRLFSHVYIVR